MANIVADALAVSATKSICRCWSRSGGRIEGLRLGDGAEVSVSTVVNTAGGKWESVDFKIVRRDGQERGLN